MKALVIFGKSIADVIFATPVIRALRIDLDEITVHVLVRPETAFLLTENPYVAKVQSFTGVFASWKKLMEEGYDLIINLDEGWRTRILSRFIMAPEHRLATRHWKKWLMVRLKINQISSKHAVERMMDVIRPLGVKGDHLGLDYFIPAHDKVSAHWLPEAYRRGYVVFCMSAPFFTRKLPLDRMIELCDKIRKPIVLLGTNEDHDNAEVIWSFFSGSGTLRLQRNESVFSTRTQIYNACGKYSFNQMASIIKQSWAVFTFDNDFVPVASAFRKQVFGLWGNTSSLFGNYPYRTRYTIMEHTDLECRPCSAHGFDQCPKGHFKCMRDIMFDFYLP
ncbi:MAG TPA: glycosyltransferase family 9 protein [Chryseolinea sp.]|nr:glycosyltransferase family 9 protein [Chryseolinea sp.]